MTIPEAILRVYNAVALEGTKKAVLAVESAPNSTATEVQAYRMGDKQIRIDVVQK